MAKLDPSILSHLEWLGFVKPAGLVVSAPAMVRAGAILNQQDAAGQRLLREAMLVADADTPRLHDFQGFARSVLGWTFRPAGYAGTPECPVPLELEVPVPEAGETLRPDFAVRELEPQDGALPWQLLVKVLPAGQGFDQETRGAGRLELTAQSRMERLLRHTGVAAGLIVSESALRLVSAPRGESSGWIDFKLADMVQTAGRPICAAMRMLLSEQALLTGQRSRRLAALLSDSRKFQNEVSEQLAEQVLHALYELLRGLQAADESAKGELLRQVLAEDASEVYRALLTVILRLVFLLFAEERDMLPRGDAFERYYSVAGLHQRLREDAALYPDTMEQRYGAWAQLVALFRMVHDGANAHDMHLPARHGVLFNPDRFPFLEGRAQAGVRQVHERIDPPLIPDGTVYRALEKLLVLDGERISYRALDVEQIGSVYETMMGFRLETATGCSVAIRSQKHHGAPATVDLDALLAEKPANRAKWLLDRADRKLSDSVKKAVSSGTSVEDLHAALQPVIDLAATPDLAAPGSMVLQPSEERRRSGSHYTPRELTQPIVKTTLDPILARLRGNGTEPARPEAILGLKVCDPAMGSGAFLVEACRYLGDALVDAWKVHGGRPTIPPDEDERVFARRLVAQRCLYGVDRNPVAVDLAKMSLWLATLARDHALTFVDHALRHGDSLVGLSKKQAEAFHWDTSAPAFNTGIEAAAVHAHEERAASLREQIRTADETVTDHALRLLWDEAQHELDGVRLLGDLALSAYFEAEKPKDRDARRIEYANAVIQGRAEKYRGGLQERRHAEPPFAPFHWEIEFPEVFERENPGFDAFVGNPPFAGKNSIIAGNVPAYPGWLKVLHTASHGNSDLVAHFFRRAFSLLRVAGVFGLIATKTIAQGDTRGTGLRWICQHGGDIFCARKRVKWPGTAAVTVSVVHATRGLYEGPKRLDGREVGVVTAFLLDRGGNNDPAQLAANAGRGFVGSNIVGPGFTFDDTSGTGSTTPIAEMERIVRAHPDYADAIRPYIGGEELNDSPTHAHHRYVINFGARSEGECRRRWPELMSIVEAKVRPERAKNNREGYRRYWWQFGEKRIELQAATAALAEVLVCSSVSKHFALAKRPAFFTFSHNVTVFAFGSDAAFALLQSRTHECFAAVLSSTLEDRQGYRVSDCFETFPFPEGWETHPALEAAGKAYYEFRAALMVRNNEGLTKTYNRFHDPDDGSADIAKLRELHAAMDKAVLDAYGWRDIPTACEHLLDYEIDEEEWGDRKKPWRYRWPDEVQAEVLARLLELNAERAKAESLAGGRDRRAAAAEPKTTTRKPRVGKAADSSPTLF